MGSHQLAVIDEESARLTHASGRSSEAEKMCVAQQLLIRKLSSELSAVNGQLSERQESHRKMMSEMRRKLERLPNAITQEYERHDGKLRQSQVDAANHVAQLAGGRFEALEHIGDERGVALVVFDEQERFGGVRAVHGRRAWVSQKVERDRSSASCSAMPSGLTT